MTTKITDEMAERAATAASALSAEINRVKYWRAILEAALNPPPEEPEIPVSEEMRRAGAWATPAQSQRMADFAASESEAIYRAMERARLKEVGWIPFNFYRRKDDPK